MMILEKIKTFLKNVSCAIGGSLFLIFGIIGSMIIIALCLISLPFLGIYLGFEWLMYNIPTVAFVVKFWYTILGYK